MKKGRGGRKERGRKSWVVKPQKGGKEVDELQDQQIHELGGDCMTDLPKDIAINILLRLSVKDLLICKCLCKTWHNIITSDPEFAKPHFAKAEVCPLIQSLSPKYVSRTLYLLEPPPESSAGYPECDDGVVSMKLDTKLKIPLLNAELLAAISNEEEGVAKGKPYIKLRPKDHKLNVVNSCNGLLCLSEPKRHDPVAVCNPITGEYINLPVPTPSAPKRPWTTACGLGFSPKAKEYKVIRIFDQKINEWNIVFNGRNIVILKPNLVYIKRMAEMHTLGTGSWKMIGDVPVSTNNNNVRALPAYLVESWWELAFPTYLNGALHWFCVEFQISRFIVSFNFDNEQFQSVLPLPSPHRRGSHMSLGVLRGCLCVCDASGLGDIKIWVMKEYGVQESWEQEFYIDSQTDKGSLPLGLYSLINYLSNGAILLFHSLSSSVFYYDPKGPTYKFLVVSGIKSRFGAIAHIPSFISLKDIVTGNNLEVLNIKSRCEELKLPGETEALFLEEETLFLALGMYT